MEDSNQFLGYTFDGRYKIDRVIGVGGMAFVYAATDEQTGNMVALKLLKLSSLFKKLSLSQDMNRE